MGILSSLARRRRRGQERIGPTERMGIIIPKMGRGRTTNRRARRSGSPNGIRTAAARGKRRQERRVLPAASFRDLAAASTRTDATAAISGRLGGCRGRRTGIAVAAVVVGKEVGMRGGGTSQFERVASRGTGRMAVAAADVAGDGNGRVSGRGRRRGGLGAAVVVDAHGAQVRRALELGARDGGRSDIRVIIVHHGDGGHVVVIAYSASRRETMDLVWNGKWTLSLWLRCGYLVVLWNGLRDGSYRKLAL